MRFALEIKLGNAAMQTSLDVADALRTVQTTLARRCGEVMARGQTGAIRDVNGNKVGTWEVKP